MTADQLDLVPDDGARVDAYPLSADGWWRCVTCSKAFRKDGPMDHTNECLRFACVQCGTAFSIFPEPLKKKFGPAPVCLACCTAPGK